MQREAVDYVIEEPDWRSGFPHLVDGQGTPAARHSSRPAGCATSEAISCGGLRDERGDILWRAGPK
jgi:hypothetical protein